MMNVFALTQTDRRTDGHTDGWTDGRTERERLVLVVLCLLWVDGLWAHGGRHAETQHSHGPATACHTQAPGAHQPYHERSGLSAGLPLPHQLLSDLLRQEGQRAAASSADELACHPSSYWWKHIQHSLVLRAPECLIRLNETPSEAQACPVCGVFYSTRSSLKAHMTKQHAEDKPMEARPVFSRLRDAMSGLPQCLHCKKNFPTWQLLERHIQGNHCAARPEVNLNPPDLRTSRAEMPARLPVCSAPSSGVMEPVALAHHETMQSLLRRHGRNMVLHVADRQKYLQRCLLCGQWTATSKIMKPTIKAPILSYILLPPNLRISVRPSPRVVCPVSAVV